MKSFFTHEVLKLSHFLPQGFVWEGDALLDWRSGGDRLFVTGECTKGGKRTESVFDSVQKAKCENGFLKRKAKELGIAN